MKEQRAAGYLIAKIHQRSGRIFAKKLKKYDIHDINPAQGRILFTLWQKDGLSIIELSKETGLSKSTLTPMLDRLEKSGLIKRVHSTEDRRKILVFITEKNKRLQSNYVSVSKKMTEIFYKNFTNEERDQFEIYLRRLHNNLLEEETQKL
ncbi:MarR family transcriptional regulator [Candidatus Heimdallarchaeota archaeon B3_Heim]|nr:MAG: MarR family transcriptional regulator [Candidatus Heimdallarchaeota archaeon B3_Heim]